MAPAENDRFGVVGIENHHHQPPDVPAEFVPQRQRRGIARQGTLVGFLARRAAAYEETAAAIVFVVAVEVRDAPDLPGARIVPAIEFAADHDPAPTPVPSATHTTSLYALASPKRLTPRAKQLQSLLTYTGTPNRFSSRSFRYTSRHDGMPTTL